MTNELNIGFWHWLSHGSGGKPGYRRIINRWVILHVFTGIVLAYVVPVAIESAASSVLLPLMGALVGLSFAWSGNAQALLQDKHIEELSGGKDGGYMDYVFTYQLAILAILVTLSAWALAGLGIFDKVWPTNKGCYMYGSIKSILFLLLSFSLRECWHVVLGAQWMLLTRHKMKQEENSK